MIHFRFVTVFTLLTLANLPARAQESGSQKLAENARGILKAACHRCHGNDGTIEGGFSYVLDRQQLVARNQIVPKSVEKSRLMRRIQAAEMPPPGESPELTKEQIDTLSQWIEAGAPDFNKSKSNRKFISPIDIIQTMNEDLKVTGVADRPFIRFLLLTHLFNAGRSGDEMLSYQHGVAKLVNSLSWGRRIVMPKLIGSPPTILRIDLRDYRWTTAMWDKLASADPYALTLINLPAAKTLYNESGSSMPYVHADWFVARASRPPLYHLILQLPQTVKELETLLHVDADDDISTAQVARAGFNGSAVSRNNRLIERHESSYGYYWKSYDFAKNVDRKNLFSHPLGPGKSESEFLHDGGEMIYSLPNGFQGYFLADGQGRRIDKGPTEIVSDPKQPDRAVENGLSCMSCHVRGIIPKDDQIRAHVQKNTAAFKSKELDTILGLYPDSARFQERIDEDAAKFRGAIEQAGVPTAITEPIMALARLFDEDLDLPMASAQASMTSDELRQVLNKTPTLARELGSLLTAGGTVKREVFKDEFPALARAAKIGVPRTRPTEIPDTKASASANPEPKTANAKGDGAWIPLGGKNKYPSLLAPSTEAVSSKDGLGTKGRFYITTKKGDFLERDFRFELVFTLNDGSANQIMFFGIGEADRNSAYNEPKNSIYMGISPPNFDRGSVALSNKITGNNLGIGRIPNSGPHRATIEKSGDVVTFSMDVDNDGPSDDDFETTIPDLKAVAKTLHKKNTFLFFGGGGTYQRLQLVDLKGGN